LVVQTDYKRFIYQLSHELGHHQIDDNKWMVSDIGNVEPMWNQSQEEFCEAISFKLLLHFGESEYYEEVIKYNDEIKNPRWTKRTKELLDKYSTIIELLNSNDYL